MQIKYSLRVWDFSIRTEIFADLTKHNTNIRLAELFLMFLSYRMIL
jgi:hypothetical protein